MYTKTLSASIFKAAQAFAVVFALLLVYAVLPASARAASLSSEQMQTVVSLLKSYGVESSVLGNVQLALTGASREEILKAMGVGMGMGSSTKPSSALPAPGACVALARTLTRGAAGDDVADLQAFLQKTGDLKEASTTNYFGPVTEAALKAWQVREGVVASGTPSTTGFGAAGPKTRLMLAERCKANAAAVGGNSGLRTNTSSTGATAVPTCTLTASSGQIAQGESTTLTWASSDATSASAVGGGRGPTSGSITVAPTETTTYLKRVYGQGGEGQCTVTVVVGDDTTPAAEKKVVIVPATQSVGRVLSLMGSGMAAVAEGYLSLFGR